MNGRTTRQAMIERYKSVLGRDAALDRRSIQTHFTMYRRNFAGLLPKEKDAAILDVACGPGALLSYLRSKGWTNVHGFDLSPENVEICRRKGLDFVDLADVFEWFEKNDLSWHAIFLNHIIEHVQKERALRLLELARDHLETGGRLVVVTPNMGALSGVYFRYNDPTHEWGLTENGLAGLFRAVGFERFDIRPFLSATTLLGRCREAYAKALHRLVYLSEGRSAPRIWTASILGTARR